MWRFHSLTLFSLCFNCSKWRTNVLIRASFQNLQDDKDTSADEDIRTETIISSCELPATLALLGGMGTTTEVWGARNSTKAQKSTCEEVRREALQHLNGGSGSRRWRRQKKMMEVLGRTETLHYFVALRMMGVWWWHKRKLLPLAPSNTLSNHSRLSSLCQAGSHLDMRRHANSFIIDEGCTFGIYVDDWRRLMFPAYLSLTWTLGMEDIREKKEKERFAAGASGNVLASDGMRTNEGRRRSTIIKRNQYHRTCFTHQLPKTKENRKETPHHLIRLIRANFLRN